MKNITIQTVDGYLSIISEKEIRPLKLKHVSTHFILISITSSK